MRTNGAPIARHAVCSVKTRSARNHLYQRIKVKRLGLHFPLSPAAVACFAALSACYASLFTCPLMGGALLMSGATTLTSDVSLLFRVH